MCLDCQQDVDQAQFIARIYQKLIDVFPPRYLVACLDSSTVTLLGA